MNFVEKLLIAGLISLVSCNFNNKQESDNQIFADEDNLIREPVHLKLEELIKTSKEIYLSDFVSDIKYIRLETNPAYLIGDKSVQVSLTDSLIIINEHGKPVGLFNMKGEFIRLIGNIGKGPGEYDFDTHFRLDSEKELIYVWNAMRGSIMTFDFMGQFLNEFSPECKPSSFGYAGNNVFVTTQFNIRYPDSILPKFVVFNEKGETINRVNSFSMNPLRGGRGVAIMLPTYYEAPGGVVINTYENDTLFKVYEDAELLPVVTWDAGKLENPFDPLMEYERYIREKERFITGVEGVESGNWWLFSYSYQGRYNMAVYNKDDRTFTVVSNPDEELRGVINDIDGGPSFWPRYNISAGKVFIDILYPTQLKRWNDEGRYERTDPVYPDRKKEFRDIVEDISLDDNPVLMLVTIK